jgi:hypothetical protein
LKLCPLLASESTMTAEGAAVELGLDRGVRRWEQGVVAGDLHEHRHADPVDVHQRLDLGRVTKSARCEDRHNIGQEATRG